MMHMALATIKHKLDLLLVLSDSVSGRAVEGNITLRKNGNLLQFYHKETGQAILVNVGREDFDLEVDAEGYEPEALRVTYSELDDNPPMLELYLMPKDRGNEYISFEGCIPGILAAEAAKVDSSAWIAGPYDERKRLLTVQCVYRREPEGARYALIAPDHASFESIELMGKSADGAYKVASPLSSASVEGWTLSRRVQGKVSGDHYLLRLPCGGVTVRWVLRVVTDAGEFFETVNFDESEIGETMRLCVLDESSHTIGITRNNIGMKGG
jgi:hypothetical protein